MRLKILAIAMVFTAFSCSDDDANCTGNKTEINASFDAQIQYVMDNPGPNGVDTTQIALLNQEREAKLAKACQ